MEQEHHVSPETQRRLAEAQERLRRLNREIAVAAVDLELIFQQALAEVRGDVYPLHPVGDDE